MLPLDRYVRVSQVAGRSGERFQSPSQQRDSIAGWAQAHGVSIGMWHEDLDRSGGTMGRPGMNRALERIEQGVSGGLVVARLDRFARTVAQGLLTIDDLHARGARVVSVAESLDPATPMGRAMLGLLLIMAEWQRDQANEHLAVAQSRAAGEGRFPGRVPFGYRRTDDGRTEVDPDAAEVVRRIFRDRADGVGWRTIAHRLNTEGVRSPLGRFWSTTTVADAVKSRAPLGVVVRPMWPARREGVAGDRPGGCGGRRTRDAASGTTTAGTMTGCLPGSRGARVAGTSSSAKSIRKGSCRTAVTGGPAKRARRSAPRCSTSTSRGRSTNGSPGCGSGRSSRTAAPRSRG